MTNVTLAPPRTVLRRRISPTALDAWLYAGSAVFAYVLWASSDLSAHRDWGRDAFVGYAASAVAATALVVIRPLRTFVVRAVIAGVCFVLVALVPMSLMVHDRVRARADGEFHVLPEAAVIERAGNLLAHGHDPYVAYVLSGHLYGQVAGVPRYEAFFPYFPAMTALGLPSTFGIGALGDARVWMTACTLLALALGLWLARAPPDRSLRAAQVMCVLPTGAVFLAGGGDDLPVLALSLVALALVARRRAIPAGVAFGAAMAMKLTAWPLAALSLFVIRDEEGRRAPGRLALVAGAIVAVFVVPFAIWNPRTFLSNVVEFPLGLSGVDSPAASPLPGHVIVTLVPQAHRALVVGLIVFGAPLLGWWLWRRPPRDVAGVCTIMAVISIVVMCFAPATRVGYVVYPVNLLVWAWLFRSVRDDRDEVTAPADSGALS
jgi:Glycosyltransferase family 87